MDVSITRGIREYVRTKNEFTPHPTTFDDLYKYRPGIFKRLLGLTHDYELAEDLCQEVFLKVWRYLPKIQHQRAIWGLLSLITKQVYMDWSRYRREKLSVCSLDHTEFENDFATERYDPDRSYADCELMRLALANSREADRKLVVDFYIHGEEAPNMRDVYEARRLLNQRYQRLLRREVPA